MEIQQTENENGGKFYIEENDLNVALMTYRKSGEGVINIDHTEVDPNHRGEGLGEDLVAEAVKFVRKNNLKVTATCPFALKILNKTTEFRDVLAA